MATAKERAALRAAIHKAKPGRHISIPAEMLGKLLDAAEGKPTDPAPEDPAAEASKPRRRKPATE